MEKTLDRYLDRKSRRKNANIYLLVALIFAAIILIGSILLSLPLASRSGTSVGYLKALFTSTSATCVTGLVLSDTWTTWSAFGIIVIIVLIQIGGLGFMSIASFIIYTFKRKASLNEEMTLAQSYGVDNLQGLKRIWKRMIIGCLSIELLGAFILSFRLVKDYNYGKAFGLGLFHSISAFCNAGFDCFGFIEPNASMTIFAKDPTILLTLSLLTIIGGLGFVVWDEVIRVRNPKKWSVYTKLVLIITASLLVIGTAGFMIAEYNNVDTIGTMTFGQKLMSSFFQSMTCRTAGFASIDQASLTYSSKILSIILMFIGGSSGSTAGGLKTVTFAAIILFAWSRIRNRKHVTVLKRTIPDRQVLDAMTLVLMMLALSIIGTLVIVPTSGATPVDAIFEAVSALCTVGLSCNVTPMLSVFARVLIIIYMYFGRVGLLTLSFAFFSSRNKTTKYKYADTNLIIG